MGRQSGSERGHQVQIKSLSRKVRRFRESGVLMSLYTDVLGRKDLSSLSYGSSLSPAVSELRSASRMHVQSQGLNDFENSSFHALSSGSRREVDLVLSLKYYMLAFRRTSTLT